MPPQRRSQSPAASSSPIPQRPPRNRCSTTRAVEGDFSQPQPHRRKEKSDSFIEVTINEEEIKKRIDVVFEAIFAFRLKTFFVRSRHNIGRMIFIYKRNDDERQTEVRRKNEIQS